MLEVKRCESGIIPPYLARLAGSDFQRYAQAPLGSAENRLYFLLCSVAALLDNKATGREEPAQVDIVEATFLRFLESGERRNG